MRTGRRSTSTTRSPSRRARRSPPPDSGPMAVALLVAAGRGERLGSPGPKAFAMCGGRPMLEWSVEALRAVPEVERVVVALPPGITAPPGTDGVPGGEQRSQSVLAALRHVRGEDDDAVIVHDTARPLVTPAIV